MMPQGDFLQSEAWAEFQTAAGHPAKELRGAGYAGFGLTHTLPLAGNYLYFPHGPLVAPEAFTSDFKTALEDMGRKASAAWLRVDPHSNAEVTLYQKLFGSFRKAPHDMQPRETFVLDIRVPEEELLAKMKGKTRYNLRLAEKKGVRVFASREMKYQEAFLDLMEQTADRKLIAPHPRAYYEKFFANLPKDMLELFVAEYDGQVLCANLVIFYGGTATYVHGGSSDAHREVMAPYLLQWEQIRTAKQRGCTRYDFGGIATQGTPEKIQAWAGITRFKQGFAPATEPFTYPGAYDIVLSPFRYAVYLLGSRARSVTATLKKHL